MRADDDSSNLYTITESGFLSPCPKKNVKKKKLDKINFTLQSHQMKPRFQPPSAREGDKRPVPASSKIHPMSPFNEKGLTA